MGHFLCRPTAVLCLLLVRCVVAGKSRAAAKEGEADDCWSEGYSRSLCCYSEGYGRFCWGGGFTRERCCAPGTLQTGTAHFAGFLGSNFFEQILRSLVARARKLPSGTAAAEIVSRDLVRAERRLLDLRNTSLTEPGTLHGGISSAFFLFLVYFVAQEALRPWLSDRARVRLLRREAVSWRLFLDIYRAAFGRTDFCRCMEGGEFYSNVNRQLRQARLGKPSFSVVLFNASTESHQIMRRHGCHELKTEQLSSDLSAFVMFSTGCVSGDLGMSLFVLHNCILEHDLLKSVMVLDSMFRLATLASDCHDAEFWPFTIRDIATQYAHVIWEIARRPPPYVELTQVVLRRLAWNPLRGDEFRSPQPWHERCGPHELAGPALVLLDDDDGGPAEGAAVGPCCTEIGRFWVRLRITRVAAASRGTLVVFPITYPFWENPFHHLHWWIAALWHLRVVSQLPPEDTYVGLAFLNSSANWGRSATTAVTAPQRSEPSQWSYLNGDWPSSPSKSLRAWEPGGLHADVLGWLSTHPARSLRELIGYTYRKVIVGLPPIRYTVQAPRSWCPQIAAVRQLVQGTRNYRALELSELMGQNPGSPRKLTIIQRARSVGRVIENLEEIEEVVRRNFVGALRTEVERRLESGTPWTMQFHAFASTDILLAAHGGVLGWIWALRRGSAVIELRGQETPVWVPCSEGWNLDSNEIFGGLAKMSGVHHICVRTSTSQAEKDVVAAGPSLSNPMDMTEWEREANLVVDRVRAVVLLREALRFVRDRPPPPCE